MDKDEEEFLNKQRTGVMFTMSFILGTKVDVATANDRLTGLCFQIMCDGDRDYFNWYCDTHPDNQFHKTPILAAMNYLKFREHWYSHKLKQLFKPEED